MSAESKPTEPRLSDLELALAEIGNQVYLATGSIEDLERQQKLKDGHNGHHLRQEFARRAQLLIYELWKNEEEKAELSPTHPVKEPFAE